MLKFDDQFPLHRKVAALSDAAFRLHVQAIFWARRNLTDGFVPTADLGTVGRFSRPDRFATECVLRALWHRVDGGYVDNCAECAQRHHGTLAGDGWVIHGFADWQQTRSKVLAVRAERSEAGKAGGIASGRSRRKREAKPKQVAERSLPNERTPEPLTPFGGSVGAPPRGGGGRGRAPTQQPPPSTSNGQATDQAKAEIHATLAATKRRARERVDEAALDRLRELTPEVPVFIEPVPPQGDHPTPETIKETP
jgi:hypothetical protein